MTRDRNPADGIRLTPLSYIYDSKLKHDTTKTPCRYDWDAVPTTNPNDTTQRITIKNGRRMSAVTCAGASGPREPEGG